MTTIHVAPTEESDALVKELVESTTYFDLATGQDVKIPKIPPPVNDPLADADEA